MTEIKDIKKNEHQAEKQPVLCPWCGEEMKLTETDAHNYRYQCTGCGAESPIEGCEDDAYREAIRRPLQKPLTLEEFEELDETDALYVEFIDDYGSCVICPAFYSIDDEIETYYEYFEYPDLVKGYNKNIRCWATKPTDEEREAAEWEK